jgi:hypothetical protein
MSDGHGREASLSSHTLSSSDRATEPGPELQIEAEPEYGDGDDGGRGCPGDGGSTSAEEDEEAFVFVAGALRCAASISTAVQGDARAGVPARFGHGNAAREVTTCSSRRASQPIKPSAAFGRSKRGRVRTWHERPNPVRGAPFCLSSNCVCP